MAITKESTPPPVIGKAGRYTVFITPPSTPKPVETAFQSPKIQSQTKVVPPSSPMKKVVTAAPPVQPPPQQFDNPKSDWSKNNTSAFGFFWNAVAKVQNAHSSLDEYLADWFGLNQSRYQWALNDYYESKGMGKDESDPKESASKEQRV